MRLLFGRVCFFFRFAERLRKLHTGLFDVYTEKGKNIESGFNAKWGWYVSIRALCELNHKEEEEILEYPIKKTLRILEFEKDKAEVAAQMIKKQNG